MRAGLSRDNDLGDDTASGFLSPIEVDLIMRCLGQLQGEGYDV